MRLQQLTQVTGLRFQADQGHLAKVSARETDLLRNLYELNVQRAQKAEIGGGSDDAASLAKVNLNWQLWIDQRRTAINAELALVRAEKVECIAQLRMSFGQNEAAQNMDKAASLSAKTALSRKANQES